MQTHLSNYRRQAMLLVILVFFCFTYTISAQNTWDGSTSTAWNNAANWSLGTIPSSSDDVVIPSAPSNQPSISSISVDFATLEVQSGATLTISSGTLSGTGGITNDGTISMSGTSTFESDIDNNGTFNWNSGGLRSVGGSTMTNSGTLNVNVNNHTPNDIQVVFVNASGGVIDMSGAGIFQRIPTAFTNDSGGSITIASGRVLALQDMVTNNGTVSGDGALELRGGSGLQTLAGDGSFTNLNINNSDNVDITGTQSVSGTLDLISGRVLLQDVNNLTVGTFANVSSTNYVVTS
ncbi:MAG: hypothetical protein AAF705_11625, partial [Bacteroidota bacterium]